MSICLVFSWSTGLAAIAMAVSLSHFKIVGGIDFKPRSLSRVLSHVTSQVVNVMDLYSAEDLATTDCFFAFQDTSESRRKMQYPDVDLLVVGQLAQSLSQYAVNLAAEEEAKRMP